MKYVRKYWHIFAGVVCVLVMGVIYIERDNTPVVQHAERSVINIQTDDTALIQLSEHVPPSEQASEDYPLAARDIMVHVEGAVNSPGVFTLPYGSRVNDALALAGGAAEEADLTRINLAAFLQDAQQVIIPAIGQEIQEIEPLESSSTAPAGSGGLININTADASQLTTLPGIGPVRAQNIINYRETQGLFTSIEQLTNVPQIGAGTLNNVRDFVTVN